MVVGAWFRHIVRGESGDREPGPGAYLTRKPSVWGCTSPLGGQDRRGNIVHRSGVIPSAFSFALRVDTWEEEMDAVPV